MTEETLQGGSPAPDAAPLSEAPADSSPAPEVAETTAAEAGNQADEIPRLQKRFDKLTWEKGELARRAEQAERRARELEERLFAWQQPEQKQDPLTPPTLEQHGHDEAKYQQAFVEYAKAVARAEAQQVARQEREQAKAEERKKTFKTREEEFASKTEDYKEKVYDETLPMSGQMVELIAESPFGPQIAYHLANNRELAAQLAAIPPIEDKHGNKYPNPLVAFEIGQIQAKLSVPPPAPPISKAPAPPPKIEAVNPEVAKDPSTMTDKEFATWRRRQIAQRRNR